MRDATLPTPPPAAAPSGPVTPPAAMAPVVTHPAAQANIDLGNPEFYFNRELSLLAFNRRVLEHASDKTTPLLERLRFLTISSTNLDEFFEIRVAGIKQQAALGLTQPEPDGRSPLELLKRINNDALALVNDQYRLLEGELLPALEAEGIRLLKPTTGQDDEFGRWSRRTFVREVLPVLTPVGLDPAHPFPRIYNKSLNFIISLEGKDAFGRNTRLAVVQAPRSLPRILPVPAEAGVPKGHNFMLLGALIRANVDELFPGMKITGCYQFRVTRNSDLWVDEEDSDDLLHTLSGELSRRNYGAAVRLEVGRDCPAEMVAFLLEHFNLGPTDVYAVDGPVNLHRLAAIYELVDRRDLKYQPFIPATPPEISNAADIFAAINARELLLHHPYQSFTPVLELARQAATDPDVLAIKMTLYRTGADSPIVDALLAAARANKEVTAVIELRARFDEAANIGLATRLQDAGANVVYGVVGFKAHAKMMLIVRREGKTLRRYAHLGTGNYHPGTARGYTDLGFLTADRDICEDVHRVFQQLTGLGKVIKLKKLLQSPFSLHKALLQYIDKEVEEARAGRPARIIAKMNSVSEPQIIRALYQASQAGVPVDLIVRGICCLRPGIPGVSENIRVRSIIGRFLEHSRVFNFHAAGREVVLCGSADWMPRNLFRRVETCFPIEDEILKKRVIAECLDVYLGDNSQTWELQDDGSYRRVRGGSQRARSAQTTLLEKLAGVVPG